MAESDLHFGATSPMDAEDTARQAKWMEELGYEYFAAGEHYMRGDPPGPSHASLPLLGVAAGATEKIKLVSSILLVPFYEPLVLARLTATLDVASGGRFILGVGVGGEYPEEFEAADLTVKQRGRRTNECLDAVRQLWTGEPVTYQGRHFKLDGASINPPPTQRPGPPVWVSGRRDAAMVRAATYGDGWMPYFYNPQRYRDSVDKIKAAGEDLGKDLTDFQWVCYPYITIYPTEEEAAQVAARLLGGQYVYGGDFINIVRDYCLLGPVERCIARLQEFIDAGARHVIFAIVCPREEAERHIETIAKEIIPHFKGGTG